MTYASGNNSVKVSLSSVNIYTANVANVLVAKIELIESGAIVRRSSSG